MRRGKDKVLYFNNKNKEKKIRNRFFISLILSFSLHIIIIILLSLFFLKADLSTNLLKLDYKAIEIKIINNSFIEDNKTTFLDNNELNRNHNKLVEKSDIKIGKDFKTNNIDKNSHENQMQNTNFFEDNALKEKELSSETEISENKNSEEKNFNGDNINQLNSSEAVNNSLEDNNEINQNSFSSKILSFSINFNSLFKYPKDALKLGVQGTVTLKIAIDRNGKVIETVLLESSGSKILDSYTLRQATYLLFSLPEINITFPLWIKIKVIYSINTSVKVYTE